MWLTLGNNEVEGHQTIICVNMDGADVNIGTKNGVAKQILRGNNNVIIMNCVAHIGFLYVNLIITLQNEELSLKTSIVDANIKKIKKVCQKGKIK